MCGRKRRAARQAWLEQRAVHGGGCGRRFGFGPGPTYSPGSAPGYGPWPGPGGPSIMTGGGGSFDLYRDAPRTEPPSAPPPPRRPPVPATRDIEKVTEPKTGHVSFLSGPFSRWKDPVRSAGSKANESNRESTTTLPPRYESGFAEALGRSDDKAPDGKRESLPPTYDAVTKY
ncbi:hypothetical protein CCHL11_05204 [Colletotrichum chlorophyti]|uniref:Uncharacterized protein n=1 Tax=Colletotrichum chlorophyti TaxID=708187 RepID=A0A1Q8RP22_9PEZI|nr:hypothetical protein CCHL11_05204 [Colletotrichum chlorophyti]